MFLLLLLMMMMIIRAWWLWFSVCIGLYFVQLGVRRNWNIRRIRQICCFRRASKSWKVFSFTRLIRGPDSGPHWQLRHRPPLSTGAPLSPSVSTPHHRCRLHRAREERPPLLQMAGHRNGTVSRRTANKKPTKLYWPSRKRSPKRLNVFLEPKKFFFPALCLPPLSNSFRRPLPFEPATPLSVRCLLDVQCRRGHRQQVSDEHGGVQQRNSVVDPAGSVHIGVRHRHSVVSFRRPEVYHEVRLVDIRRHQDQPHCQGGHHRHLDLSDQRRMGTSQ